VTKSFGFKAWALVASLGLAATLVGCNPDEPAKPTGPPGPPVAKAPVKATDTKGAAPAPVTTPAKGAEK